MIPQVCLLTKAEIGQYWSRIEWRFDLTPALMRFFTKEDIVDKLCKDEMQLWTAGSDLVVLSMCVETPIGKVFQVVWMHGEGLEYYFDELQEKFNTFAWLSQCVKMEIFGRPGWARKLQKQKGFRVEYVAYGADVQKPRMN